MALSVIGFDGTIDETAFAKLMEGAAWTGGGVDSDNAIRGFHSASLRLRDEGATAELLKFMGYEASDSRNGITRFVHPRGNGANLVDVETLPGAAPAEGPPRRGPLMPPPFSITIMNGLALSSAIKLSMIKLAWPCLPQPVSSSPIPCCR